MPAHATLASVLRLPASEGGEFLYALEDWVRTPERHALPFAELPEPARMILVLREMFSAIDSSGMMYVMDWSIGEQFHEAVKWARQLGAEHTVAYFTAAAAQFPRKRVPKDQQQRLAALMGADDESDPFDELDDEYRERVLAEIPRKLRAYLKANRASIERKLATPARRARNVEPDEVLPYDRTDGDNVEWRVRLARRHAEAAAAGRLRQEGFPPEVVCIGDVIEVKSRWGAFYLHATHGHPMWRMFGPVVRVLPDFYRQPVASIESLLDGPTAFYSIVDVNADIKAKRARVVAHVPAPAAPFPIFRYDFGKTRDGRWGWRRWEGGETGVGDPMVEPLTPEQRAYAMLDTDEGQDVAQKLRDGWRTETYVFNPELYTDLDSPTSPSG